MLAGIIADCCDVVMRSELLAVLVDYLALTVDRRPDAVLLIDLAPLLNPQDMAQVMADRINPN